MRVKICGMTSIADVRACVDAGADALGFIFASSPRRLPLVDDLAKSLTDAVPPFVTCVGIFADDPPELIRAALARCRIDVLQFAGSEAPHFCGSFGKPTILVSRGRAYSAAELAAANARAVLVDGYAAGMAGGTGRTVDARTFARVREASGRISMILAGGLHAGNVASMIRAIGPDAVDVRTGVERDGHKDRQLVASFVRIARSASAREPYAAASSL